MGGGLGEEGGGEDVCVRRCAVGGGLGEEGGGEDVCVCVCDEVCRRCVGGVGLQCPVHHQLEG